MSEHPISVTRSTPLVSSPATSRSAPRYDEVPLFRKRWMLTVLFLVFTPAMIVICVTGPVYQNDRGEALDWAEKERYQAATGGVLLTAIALLVLFDLPAR